ncbi:hypothetical protein [Aggregatilinea lenta]|uniref:hypothetical protein n=1 Tax=Aggregatilinea lenta TaxID=913108 RepID=UPI000E5B73C8|nr:hypothetical protein [Aggregatilinea lenta]
MDIDAAIHHLEVEWDRVYSKGFFGKLLMGVFDAEGFERVKDLLNAAEMPDGAAIDRRFVEVTWFIPTYMRWQRDAWHLDGRETAELDRAIDYFEQRLTTILGLP